LSQTFDEPSSNKHLEADLLLLGYSVQTGEYPSWKSQGDSLSHPTTISRGLGLYQFGIVHIDILV